MYKAKHYVRIKGRMYKAGECIPNDLSPESITWLVSAGAIESVVPAVFKEAPEPEKHLVVQEPATEHPTEDFEEEAPTIDVMDGVIPKKTTKRAGRRKAK